MLTVFDLSNANTAPVDSWWSLGRYSDPDWNQNNLGNIFEYRHLDDGDIFVTSTRSWNSDWPGIGGWGAIYRIDRYTGDITVFATLPNTNSGLGSIRLRIANIRCSSSPTWKTGSSTSSTPMATS